MTRSCPDLLAAAARYVAATDQHDAAVVANRPVLERRRGTSTITVERRRQLRGTGNEYRTALMHLRHVAALHPCGAPWCVEQRAALARMT